MITRSQNKLCSLFCPQHTTAIMLLFNCFHGNPSICTRLNSCNKIHLIIVMFYADILDLWENITMWAAVQSPMRWECTIEYFGTHYWLRMSYLKSQLVKNADYDFVINSVFMSCVPNPKYTSHNTSCIASKRTIKYVVVWCWRTSYAIA